MSSRQISKKLDPTITFTNKYMLAVYIYRLKRESAYFTRSYRYEGQLGLNVILGKNVMPYEKFLYIPDVCKYINMKTFKI